MIKFWSLTKKSLKKKNKSQTSLVKKEGNLFSKVKILCNYHKKNKLLLYLRINPINNRK